MALNKFKVCPVCGEHNAPSLFECRKCEADLTGIKVVDNLSEVEPEKAATSSQEELFRVCECGEINPPQARKCRACGEDISDIMPSKHAAPAAKPFTYKLEALEENNSSSIEDTVFVIGREAGLRDYLTRKTFVSRQQAKLTVVAGKVFIENLSKTNNTFVNNNPIDDGQPYTLKDGDEIGLGGKKIGGKRQDDAAYFRFRTQS